MVCMARHEEDEKATANIPSPPHSFPTLYRRIAPKITDMDQRY